jgi:hypothetical protein
MRTLGFIGYLLLCHTQNVVSQQVIEKKDHRNRVYERVYIQQNDTLFTDYFYENGLRGSRRSRDTVEEFALIPPYHRTLLSYRLLGNPDRKWMRLADNGENEYRLSQLPQRVQCSYYPNGQPHIDFSWQGDSLLTYRLYAKNGHITSGRSMENKDETKNRALRLNDIGSCRNEESSVFPLYHKCITRPQSPTLY